jgi:hypothetical protein
MTVAERLLSFSRAKAVWGGDGMGFKTGTLICPKHPSVLLSVLFVRHRRIRRHSCEN